VFERISVPIDSMRDMFNGHISCAWRQDGLLWMKKHTEGE